MKRVVMSLPDIRAAMDELRANKVYFIAGSSSLWIPSTQTKVIDGSVAKEWPDQNGEMVFMTPGEAARTELSRAFPDCKRVGWHKGHIKQLDWRPPCYCNPVGEGDFTQLDLDAAYWNIYRYLWLNTPFPCGYGTMPLFNVAERLKDWKQARNALMGIIRARHALAYRGKQRLELKTTNKFLSPGLWATTQAILNEVATAALACGAVYIATDGYTFRRDDAGLSHFTAYLEEVDLPWRVVREGRGEIAGWCCYKIASKETYIYKTGGRPYGKVNSVTTETTSRFTTYLEKCRRRNRAGQGLGSASERSISVRNASADGPSGIQPTLFNLLPANNGRDGQSLPELAGDHYSTD